MIKSGRISDHRMVNTMIAVYGKLDRLKELKQIFEEADRRALIHINAMAAALVQAGYYSDAMKLFKATRRLEVKVDGSIISVVLKACCGLTSLEQGKNVHSLALKLGIGQDKFVGSATIDNYCKCGSLDNATKAFIELPKGNQAIWNAMITGYAQHGNHDKAIEEFNKMLKYGLEPDEITFLGVLYSCCHSGLVKEAYYYFNSMFDNYGLAPSLEHYACVIDLLGRTGRLEEAKMCIDRMPIVPDARVWQSFLMACSAYQDVDLGKIAAEKLLELEPDNESAYVLLSSIYAALGMWDDVRRVRRGMREKTVCKEPGCSWIQVRGSCHSFFASGTSHPQTLDIYLMLEVLNMKMVVVGGHRTRDGSSLQEQESLAYHGLNL